MKTANAMKKYASLSADIKTTSFVIVFL